MRYMVRMETTAVITLPIEAEDRQAAEVDAMYSPTLPRHLVRIGPEGGLPDGTTVTLDNKGWQVLEEVDE